MNAILNILILEDNQSDADLICRELKKSGLSFITKIVQTRTAFEESLLNFNPDLILSDYSLPSFDAVSAFRIKQNRHAHIPFIIVSGVIGEENAVELIKDGVTDYVSKQKLFTLFTKINRALSDIQVRNEKVIIAEKLRLQTVELIVANRELVFQNSEREKRTADLVVLAEEIKNINLELSALNQELENRVVLRTKALADSESLFRNMMETIPQIAWTNTIAGKVIFYNQRWREYTGLSDWKNFLSIIHQEERKTCLKNYLAILHSREGGEFQIRGKRNDGAYRWHLIRLMPILDELGQIQLWVGTATDIEELKLIQQQKDDFISIASHELKTPITTLKASLQLLDRIKDNPSKTMLPILITKANKSLEKINTLIEDLLDASLVNKGQLHINPKNFQMVQFIQDSCKDIHLDDGYFLQIEADKELEVFADPVRIEQILVNFISNAVKYAPESNQIKVTIEREKDKVKVAVKDTGRGISSEKLAHIFERYYRVNTNESKYTGLGLGLYICSEIIKKHSGEIGVESTIGNGSSFWFTLPIVEHIKS